MNSKIDWVMWKSSCQMVENNLDQTWKDSLAFDYINKLEEDASGREICFNFYLGSCTWRINLIKS